MSNMHYLAISGLNFNNHLSNHTFILSRSFGNDNYHVHHSVTHQIFVSSANIHMLFLIQFGRSLINSKKRISPNADSSGTLLSTRTHLEKLFLTLTLIFPECKKL